VTCLRWLKVSSKILGMDFDFCTPSSFIVFAPIRFDEVFNICWNVHKFHLKCMYFYCPILDFGCTHPIDGLFWSLPIYLMGFFSKYECQVIDLNMPLYHFIFLGCHLPFCIMRFHITMKCKKQFIWLIFKMKFVW
jgi:hypothetical protein